MKKILVVLVFVFGIQTLFIGSIDKNNKDLINYAQSNIYQELI